MYICPRRHTHRRARTAWQPQPVTSANTGTGKHKHAVTGKHKHVFTPAPANTYKTRVHTLRSLAHLQRQQVPGGER